ncbi:MAG: leucine-rich repeat protein, partial [Clostridia bacterium]|nr:leucine-rich repeat protein [Clostridia bacterium]
VTSLPAASSDWGLDSYKADVTKVVITAPITSLSGVVRTMFTKAEIIELPTSCKTIEGSALNNYRSLHTVYTTGQEMVEGTFNLSNITLVKGYALVWNSMDTVIIGENCTFSGSAMFWQPNLSKVVISEGATIGTQSFVSGTSTSDGRVWKDTSVEFPKSMGVIPAAAFYGNQGTDLSSVFPNNVVVEITVKNPDALFAIATNATANDYEGFVTWMSALKTVKGTVGSTAETFVNWANEYFAENEIDRAITFEAIDTVASGMPIGDDLWYRILDNGDETYTLDIYGTGTTAYAADKDGNKVSMSWNFIDENRSFNEYASKITKIKISAPNVKTYQGYMFKGTNATHLELNPNITSIAGGSDFNGIAMLTTVYVTGNEPVEGVADFSNIKTFGQYAFVNHKFNKIVLSEELKTIPYWCFGSESGSVLNSVEIPASVTSIESLAFNKAAVLAYVNIAGDNVTIKSDAFNGCSAYATVIANTGSTAEAYAETMGLQFIDRANVNNIVAVYRNNNSVILLDKVDDKNVTAYATGSATNFSFGYTSWGNAVSGDNANRPWQTYKSLITKVVFVNPALTKFDASFATHTALTTVEIPASTRTVGSNAFNGSALTTLYIAGNEAKEGVVDLTNITALGDMCLASSKAHTILLNDDLSGAWGQNLFFRCDNLLYIRVPVGVTSLDGTTFFNSSKLNTVLFESKTTVIGASAFSGCTGLKTIIGYRGSTAETYANANGLEFIPLETESLLT